MYSENGITVSSADILTEIIESGAVIESPCKIAGVSKFDVRFFGAYSFCRGGRFVMVDSIGRFCSIAPNVVIGPEEHDTRLLTTSTFLNSEWDNAEFSEYWERNSAERQNIFRQIRSPDFRNRKKVVIGNDVWIGQNALIRRGVTIGDGAVIGAHAVVSKDVAPYSMVMGSPATHMRFRFAPHLVEILTKVKWWNWSLDSLDGISWSDPEAACKELLRRYEAGAFKTAEYATFKPVIASDICL